MIHSPFNNIQNFDQKSELRVSYVTAIVLGVVIIIVAVHHLMFVTTFLILFTLLKWMSMIAAVAVPML